MTDLTDIRGCTSHSCVIRPPEGMGTNSTCRCVDFRGQRYIAQLRRALADIEKEYRAYRFPGAAGGVPLTPAIDNARALLARRRP